MISPLSAYQQVQSDISDACLAAGRQTSEVQLLAVSKGQTAAKIRALASCGQLAFGENYLQEALAKMAELSDLPLQWHFIGKLQANKSAQVAANFEWVHSVDRIKLATRLNEQRSENLTPLNVCVQVNIDDESSKGGVAPDSLNDLIEQSRELPRLRLRGLMALPAPAADFSTQRTAFAAVKQLQRRLNTRRNIELDTLSMGTSADFRAAIAEQATIIRIGTALFGPRNG